LGLSEIEGLNMKIDLFAPKLPSTEDLYPLLKQVEDNRQYSNFGPMVTNLCSILAGYFGVGENQIVTLANATLALEGAVQTSNTIGPWLTPSWTYAATNLALERNKMEFEFGDIDDDWRLKGFDEYSAIMDVCPFGDALDIERFRFIKSTLLIDAAASFPSLKNCGAIINNRHSPIGIVVSFHPTKVVPGVEGSVFISNDISWVRRVRAWSRFGMEPESRVSNFAGTNAKMNEFQAAVIIRSIKEFPSVCEQWVRNHEKAQQVSNSLGFKVQPGMKRGSISSYWIIQGTQDYINRIEKRATSFGFETRRWWENGCHKMPVFRHKKVFNLERTDLIANSTLGLPFHLFMGDLEFEYIHDSLQFIME
jgi:dTDP-4-amino-4,6-dideoxygalactose transaminase